MTTDRIEKEEAERLWEALYALNRCLDPTNPNERLEKIRDEFFSYIEDQPGIY